MKKRKSFKGRGDRLPQHRAGGGGGGREGWIYGLHAVTAALANPAREPIRLIATPQAAEELSPAAFSLETVTREDIDAVLPPGAVHQGVALLAAPLPPVALGDLCARTAAAEREVVVMLDQVSDPHNVGAVLRSAAVFGAVGVVVPDRGAPEVTGVLAKAASGALETVPLVRVTNLSRALDMLKESGFWCAGLDSDGETEIDDADFSGKTVLVLGAEGAGLRRLVRERCDFLVRIPSPGSLASLNVSNAAAVALYEFARRG